jgi:AcrR family transcriptional regulator
VRSESERQFARAAGIPGYPAGGHATAGLRERKKARTRAAIRQNALRLFRDQGYAATTVEQIAEAAEVSPSTFFRYFPTKEDVVLRDDIDILAVAAFEAQPPGLSPITALRRAVGAAFAGLSAAELAELRETTALTLAVPDLRARALDEVTSAMQKIAEVMARRAGRDPGDFAVRNLAGAIVGVIMSATMMAATDPAAASDLREDVPENLLESIDAALAHLEAGLPL